jgi:signal transduction histidine kinase
MRLFSRFSLSARLTIFAIATLCPLAVLIILSHLDDRDQRKEAKLDEATTFTRNAAATLEGFARDMDSFTAAAAVVLGANPEPLTQANSQAYLRGLSTRYPNLSAMFITDLSGRVTAQANGDDTGFDVSSRPYIQALKSGADTVWTGGLSGIRTGEVLGAFGRIIRNPDGSPKAFLIAAFRPSNILESLPPDFPSDANIVLIDQNGKMIFNARDPEFKTTPAEVRSDPLVAGALGGEFTELDGDEAPFDQGDRFGALAPVPHMKWAIGYTRSQAILNASLRDKLLRDLGLLAAIVALTIAALTVVARQMTRPLANLARAAGEVAQGHRAEVPLTNADPDVANLQRAFVAMSAAVAEREERLQEQARILGTLEEVGAWIASDLDLKQTVQAVTDAGTRVTDAEYGAFFSTVGDNGSAEPYQLRSRPADGGPAFNFDVLRGSQLFGRTLLGEGPIRIADLTAESGVGSTNARSNGQAVTRSYLAVPITNPTGEVIGGLFFGHSRPGVFQERHERLAVGIASWAAIALDNARLFSEAQTVQEQLRDANRAKDEFLGLVSHELRTPTSTIYGGIRILETRRELLGPDATAELIGSISEEAARLVRLIENLLAFARLELGRDIERVPVAVSQAARQVVESFARSHPGRDFVGDYGETLPPVLAEPTYFGQILQNLLSNADKYSPAGEPVEIATFRVGDEVQIIVSDHGPGVPEEETTTIFESFYRSRETSDMASGHGLGLSVCKRLVEAQDGRIWAINLPRGGLAVGFAFPVRVEEHVEAPVES